MCGIVGLVSDQKQFKQAYNALRSLEYRGYDSFGFGVLVNNKIDTLKRIGAISDTKLEDFSAFFNSQTIIGHTRWATHGRVTEYNSHPHLSSDESIALVHNGVIANFSTLITQNPQWHLRSETDTEVAANIIADLLKKHNGNIIKALNQSLDVFEGEFAICGMIANKPKSLFAIKRKSPLAVGQLADSLILSSDRTAFCQFASRMAVLYLEDESILWHTDNKTQLYQRENTKLVECSLAFEDEILEEQASYLGHYPHYMVKEINEIPQAVVNMGRNLKKVKTTITNEMLLSDISMTGSGSAYYATMIAQYYFSNIGGIYVPVHPADEYLNIKSLSRRDFIIAVSQSGETFDTLEILREAQKKKAGILAINNVEKCSMQQLADFPIYQQSGQEICVLSTKSIISQVSGLYLFAVEIGRRTGKLSEENYAALLNDYEKMPQILTLLIASYAEEIKSIAVKHCHIEHWFFIGRGAHYPVALESALKFKEVSYLHAEAMPAGFLKHGTISLIDENFYTVVFLPSQVHEQDLYQATLDNIYEIKARGGKIIGIGHQTSKKVIDDLFFDYIALPDVNPQLNILIQLVTGQLLAYYSAVALNRNIDKPRALAKSVTVR
jgi:glucosamine--fructose-6-phosphate aminotransferase (isomerizing)